MKNLSYLLFTFISLNLFAINSPLEPVIPNDANMVIRLNGKKISDKIGIKNIYNSGIFMNYLKDVIFTGNSNNKIEDIGISLEKDLYFFTKRTEKIAYTAYLYPIAKAKLFAKYIAEKNSFVETVKKQTYTVIFYQNEREVLAWNNRYAIFIHFDYTNYSDNVDMTEIEMYEEVLVEEAAEAVEVEESTESEAAYQARIEKELELREKARRESLERKRALYFQEMDPIFNLVAGQKSILDNASYANHKNNTADFSFWVDMRSYSKNYGRYYGGYYGYYGFMSSIMSSYIGEEIKGHVYFNEEEIKLSANMAYSEEIQKWMNQIYAARLPKSFLKYIPNQNILGLTSLSLNSTKFWEAFPQVYTQILNKSFSRRKAPDPKQTEAFSVLADFLSIMIDENDLGKLMTGNGMFVLKNLLPVKVTYKSYEYNEDYSEYKEVEKTKTDMMPDFLMVFGAENKVFMTKLLNLAMSNDMLLSRKGYYYTDGNNRDFPYKIYFFVNDEMVFISSDENEILAIAGGTFTGGVDKKMGNNLIRNNGYGSLDIKELLSRIDVTDMSVREVKSLEYAKANTGKLEYFNRFENGVTNYDVNYVIPENFENAAKYLWDFIHKMDEIEKAN